MTQRELAAKANIDYTYISKIENHKEDPPSDETIEQMALALDYDPYEMLLEANRIPNDFKKLILSDKNIFAFLKVADKLNYKQWQGIKKILENN